MRKLTNAKTVFISVINGNLLLDGEIISNLFALDEPESEAVVTSEMFDYREGFKCNFVNDKIIINGRVVTDVVNRATQDLIKGQASVENGEKIQTFVPKDSVLARIHRSIINVEGGFLSKKIARASEKVIYGESVCSGILQMSNKACEGTAFADAQARYAENVNSYLERIPEESELPEALAERAQSIEFSITNAMQLTEDFLGQLPDEMTKVMIKNLPREWQKRDAKNIFSVERVRAMYEQAKKVYGQGTLTIKQDVKISAGRPPM
ncbi:MAG: hypothetical protein LBM38_05880 [Clostridiales bacterium]|jgi:hypothetical protein|nr:hypothetical protein [Clostridiales bacterium]